MKVNHKVFRMLRDYGVMRTGKKLTNRFGIKYLLGGRYFPCMIDEKERERQSLWHPKDPVLISLVIPLYQTPHDFLCQMLESIFSQTYPYWELCLTDVADSDGRGPAASVIEGYPEELQKKIKYQVLPENRGISGNTNAALEMAGGEFVGFMDHDDILHASALYYIARQILYRDADLVYTDELSFQGRTDRVQSIHFKPGFCPDDLSGNNYICHFTVCRKELVEQAGGFDLKMDGAQDYDLLLKLSEQEITIRHVNRVLYYWRLYEKSSASGLEAKPYVVGAGKRALEEHFQRMGIAANVQETTYGPFYQIDYEIPDDICVLILCEDEQMVPVAEEQARMLGTHVFVKYVGEWKWSDGQLFQLCKELFQETNRCLYGVFLKSGYTPNDENWIRELISSLQPAQTMISSALLFDQNDRIRHAGYAYDRHFKEKIRPLYQGVSKADPGYMNHLVLRQNVSLAGGAVLGVKLYGPDGIWKPSDDAGFPLYNSLGKALSCVRERSLFDDRLWFSLCLFVRNQNKYVVVTPFTAFYVEQEQSKKEDWHSFLKDWEEVLSRKDVCFPQGMVHFGKYYDLL